VQRRRLEGHEAGAEGAGVAHEIATLHGNGGVRGSATVPKVTGGVGGR
jgi:hypothetical protein